MCGRVLRNWNYEFPLEYKSESGLLSFVYLTSPQIDLFIVAKLKVKCWNQSSQEKIGIDRLTCVTSRRIIATRPHCVLLNPILPPSQNKWLNFVLTLVQSWVTFFGMEGVLHTRTHTGLHWWKEVTPPGNWWSGNEREREQSEYLKICGMVPKSMSMQGVGVMR